MGNEELHEIYEERLNTTSASSFREIRRTAVDLLKERFDERTRNGFYEDLNRGVAVIDREELLWQYLWSFGPMHQRKMDMALGKLPKLENLVKDGFSVVDWGCGQGLATVCLLDFMKARGIDALPDQTRPYSSSRPRSHSKTQCFTLSCAESRMHFLFKSSSMM